MQPLQKLIAAAKTGPARHRSARMLSAVKREDSRASRDMVYDRTMSFLSTLNVMSGLVLAAIAPLALYPLDTKTLPAGPKRQMGDVFNVMAYAAVRDRRPSGKFNASGAMWLDVLFAHGRRFALAHSARTMLLSGAAALGHSSSAPSRWATTNLYSSG